MTNKNFNLLIKHLPGRTPSASKSAIKGRLLSPEQGCGFTKVRNNRIVAGIRAKPGKCKPNKRPLSKFFFFFEE